MKSLFSPRTAAFISRSQRGDTQWYAECSSVPSRDTRVNVFNDLTSLLRPKKGPRLSAAWLFLKAESCKAKISEGIQGEVTTEGTCYYTRTHQRGKCPHPSPDMYSLLIIFKTDFIGCFLRQGSVFLVTPGTRITPPRRDEGAMRNLELVFGGRIILASTFIIPRSSLGCVLPPKGTGSTCEALQAVGIFVMELKR